MKNWKQTLKRFLRDEEGQSTTEYILILAVVVMIAMKFREQIGSKIEDATGKIGDGIGGHIEETLGN